jgi:hypothetical protein
MLHDPALLLRAAHSREEGAGAIHAHVKILPAGVAQEFQWLAFRIMAHVAEITGLLIPGVTVERVCPGIDIRLVLIHIVWLTHGAGSHLHDFSDAEAMRGADHRCDHIF